MTIVKRNVEASGGTIEVFSEPGKGTRMHITLRAADADVPRGAESAERVGVAKK